MATAEVVRAVPTNKRVPQRAASQRIFRVGDAAFWQYFQARGGIRTFGYPVSRVFMLDGFKVQIFQREVMQLQPD